MHVYAGRVCWHNLSDAKEWHILTYHVRSVHCPRTQRVHAWVEIGSKDSNGLLPHRWLEDIPSEPEMSVVAGQRFDWHLWRVRQQVYIAQIYSILMYITVYCTRRNQQCLAVEWRWIKVGRWALWFQLTWDKPLGPIPTSGLHSGNVFKRTSKLWN